MVVMVLTAIPHVTAHHSVVMNLDCVWIPVTLDGSKAQVGSATLVSI